MLRHNFDLRGVLLSRKPKLFNLASGLLLKLRLTIKCGEIYLLLLYIWIFGWLGEKGRKSGKSTGRKGKEKVYFGEYFFDKVGWDMNLTMKKNRQ